MYELQTYLGEDDWPSLPFKEPFRLHHVNNLRGKFLHLSLFKIDPGLKKIAKIAVILEKINT